ncbi:hypothetical protein Pflav_059060 [Phytohabitans flavus]|uniref:YrdC-like domain-containing protein n=1 Tax=Phytohabitans flavus TaxID=1076124 RepID=A0A6F8Y066_9ACTN|nr:hypothetical protein Pflav_059060 [Phytohabitans flavus]
MKYLHGFQEALPQVKDCLLDGGVALLPTDTVYGLAVHPTRPDAAARLFAMKRRPRVAIFRSWSPPQPT